MISCCRFICAHRAEFGVKRLCRVLGVRGRGFYDAAVESWFATMKTEIGTTTTWTTREQARRDVFAYIGYYSHNRLHSALGYRTPREARIGYRHDHALAA